MFIKSYFTIYVTTLYNTYDIWQLCGYVAMCGMKGSVYIGWAGYPLTLPRGLLTPSYIHPSLYAPPCVLLAAPPLPLRCCACPCPHPCPRLCCCACPSLCCCAGRCKACVDVFQQPVHQWLMCAEEEGWGVAAQLLLNILGQAAAVATPP